MEKNGDLNMTTNLERFLLYTTPLISSQSLSKSEIRKLNKLWNPCEKEKMDYFTLGDLWDNNFDQWSACGAEVPIVTRDGRRLLQYFVPYLSAIQIFTSNNPPSINSTSEENRSADGAKVSVSESLSDESESEKLSSSSEEGVSGSDSSRRPPSDRLGDLYCQYFEKISPFGRLPLMDKITSLAQRYPGLKTLRSVDLSPASWMAVAWYPIYPIPLGRNSEDLKASFLTYHTFSASFQDTEYDDEKVEKKTDEESESTVISLPPFGLATYKLLGDVWLATDKNNGQEDRERLVSLLRVADSWLKQLRVQHHDFNFFTGVHHH